MTLWCQPPHKWETDTAAFQRYVCLHRIQKLTKGLVLRVAVLLNSAGQQWSVWGGSTTRSLLGAASCLLLSGSEAASPSPLQPRGAVALCVSCSDGGMTYHRGDYPVSQTAHWSLQCLSLRACVRRLLRWIAPPHCVCFKCQTPLMPTQRHWKQRANTCRGGPHNNGAMLFQFFSSQFAIKKKKDSESLRVFLKAYTAGLWFRLLPVFSRRRPQVLVEALKCNKILYILGSVLMHARTSDSQRAFWWTSESTLFLFSVHSAIPWSRDSWRRCALTGHICSSMSSNHGHTSWWTMASTTISVSDRLRPMTRSQTTRSERQQFKGLPTEHWHPSLLPQFGSSTFVHFSPP